MSADFPWLLSNVTDKNTGLPLANAAPFHTLEWNGWKLGFLGLIELEWLETLSCLIPGDVSVSRVWATFFAALARVVTSRAL